MSKISEVQEEIENDENDPQLERFYQKLNYKRPSQEEHFQNRNNFQDEDEENEDEEFEQSPFLKGKNKSFKPKKFTFALVKVRKFNHETSVLWLNNNLRLWGLFSAKSQLVERNVKDSQGETRILFETPASTCLPYERDDIIFYTLLAMYQYSLNPVLIFRSTNAFAKKAGVFINRNQFRESIARLAKMTISFLNIYTIKNKKNHNGKIMHVFSINDNFLENEDELGNGFRITFNPDFLEVVDPAEGFVTPIRLKEFRGLSPLGRRLFLFFQGFVFKREFNFNFELRSFAERVGLIYCNAEPSQTVKYINNGLIEMKKAFHLDIKSQVVKEEPGVYRIKFSFLK